MGCYLFIGCFNTETTLRVRNPLHSIRSRSNGDGDRKYCLSVCLGEKVPNERRFPTVEFGINEIGHFQWRWSWRVCPRGWDESLNPQDPRVEPNFY